MNKMKLYFNQTSPYARKARVVVAEKQLTDLVEMIDVDPWQDPPALLHASPLSKVPVLVTADGVVLTESDTIVRYLDEIVPAHPLLPAAGAGYAARAEALARMSLAQGMIDAAFDSVIEKRRPAAQQSQDAIQRQHRALERGLAVIDKLPRPDGRFDLGDVSLACLLGYLDFRLPQIAWRDAFPAMAAWQDLASHRPSMISTAPD